MIRLNQINPASYYNLALLIRTHMVISMFLYTTAKFVCVGRTVVEIGTVHPGYLNLDYPTPQLSERKIAILQDFAIANTYMAFIMWVWLVKFSNCQKQCGVPKMH